MSSISLTPGLANLDPASLAGSLSQSASQITALLPSTSTALFNSSSAIYDVIGSQALGELGGSPGWQAYVLSQQNLAASASSNPASSTSGASSTPPTDSSANLAPPVSVTDELLKESGWQAPTANPYVVTRDFLATQFNTVA